MKTKKILSTILIFALALNILCLSASAHGIPIAQEKIFTLEMLEEFIGSDSREIELPFSRDVPLKPSLAGEVSFSEPFRIPGYHLRKKTASVSWRCWFSAIFCDGRLKAIAAFQLGSSGAVMTDIIYMPYELTEKIAAGGEMTIFVPEPWDDLLHCVDKNGNSSIVSKSGYLKYETSMQSLDTTAEDFKAVCGYNLLSGGMKKTDPVKFDGKKPTGEVVVKMNSLSRERWICKGSENFILRTAGTDENGETLYTLSLEKYPKKKLKLSGSNKFYLRCTIGGSDIAYKICSAKDPGMALTLSDGKVRLRRWKGGGDQQWIINEAYAVNERWTWSGDDF